MRNILDQMGANPKIAVVRGGGMGDFLSITPALRALKKGLPGARITLITSPRLVELAGRYPPIDRVVVAPRYAGVSEGPEGDGVVERFFREMQQERFDLALQWHGGGANSNPFTKHLGARLSAGFQDVDAPGLDLCLPYDLRQHEILRYLDLLSLLGIEADGLAMEVPPLPSDTVELGALGHLVDLDALEAGRYLGVHVGAGAESRRWSPQRFAAVANALLEEFNLRGVIVTAGDAESGIAAEFLDHLPRPDRAVDLSGKTTLGALIALIGKLGLFVGNDTGAAHIANALNTPCVVVFGSAHPVNWAPLNRAWHRVVADWTAPCRLFRDDGCPNSADVPCLCSVQVDAVLQEARRLLQMKRRKVHLECASPRPPRRTSGSGLRRTAS